VKAARRGLIGIALIVSVATAPGLALRWLPAELDLGQAPGTVEVYRLTVHNNSEETEQVTIFVQDWLRDEGGANDFDLPANGARWVFARSFAVGETVSVSYSFELPADGAVDIGGAAIVASPQASLDVGGVSRIDRSGATEESAVLSAEATIERSLVTIDEAGVATMVVTITAKDQLQGLALYESLSVATPITGLDAAGGAFASVDRSCGSWVSLSADRVELAADESQDILVTISTPADYDGSYWCIVMAELVPRVLEQNGTRILAVPQVGAKLFVSAPGTEALSGQITGVTLVEEDPVTLEATFVNTGNVQLVVTGAVQIIDRNGDVVRQFAFEESSRDYFRVLPGSTRVLTLTDPAADDPLPEGIYQALVTLDFGGENPVGGVRAFQIR